ncbi:MAG TPA: chalcone isomerase family protein [Candidatus Omnitrophota bacterium]|nr:hypothetical protein [Candidatus Omnitrophota bacterium]HRK61059.1 chalcone isomerase family protein [Candidatus Omnitrophota bacterium]
MKKNIAALFILSLSIFFSGWAETKPSVCKKKVCFESAKEIAGIVLPVHGVELLEYIKLDLYTAALYAPVNANSVETVLDNVPKSLILHYHRAIKKEWMIQASRDRIKKNPLNDSAKLEDRLKQLDAAYQKVNKGDRYELRYEPELGTSLILNGKLQATIKGEDFQRAFFGIWLSEVPLNKKLRNKLLKASL